MPIKKLIIKDLLISNISLTKQRSRFFTSFAVQKDSGLGFVLLTKGASSFILALELFVCLYFPYRQDKNYPSCSLYVFIGLLAR